MAFYNNMDIEP